MIKERPSRERVDESVPGLLEDIASNVRERVVEGEGGGGGGGFLPLGLVGWGTRKEVNLF